MSLFPNALFGGYWGGYQLAPLLATAPPDQDKAAKPGDPVDRSQGLGGFGTYGNPYARTAPFDKAPPGDDWLYSHIRKYHAVVLAMAAIVNPILAAGRTLEVVRDDGDPATPGGQNGPVIGDGVTADPLDKLKAALQRHFDPLWPDILSGLEFVHWGRWTQEVAWDRVNGLTLPTEFNDFLPWEIQLYRDKYGKFGGFKYGQQERDPRYAFHAVHLPHLNRLWGWPRAEYARVPWWRAQQSEDNGDRAERKASGISFLALVDPYYQFKDANGNAITGEVAVQTVFNSLSTGGAAMAPRYTWTREAVQRDPKLADVAPIKVEQYQWGDTGPAIMAALARLNEQNRAIVQAYGRPAREVLEPDKGGIGQGDSATQGSVGLLDSEMVAGSYYRQFNDQVLNRTLVTNMGPAYRGRLFFKPAQLTATDKAWKQALVAALAALPTGDEMNDLIDRRELGAETELQLLSKDEIAKRQEQAKADQQQQMEQQAALAAAQPAAAGGNGQPGTNGNGNGRMAGKAA